MASAVWDAGVRNPGFAAILKGAGTSGLARMIDDVAIFELTTRNLCGYGVCTRS